MKPLTASQTRRRDQTSLSRLNAVKLRIAGAGYRQIAEELKVSVKTAWTWVKEELAGVAEQRKEEAESLWNLEMERIEDLHRRLYMHMTQRNPARLAEWTGKGKRRKLVMAGEPPETDADYKERVRKTTETLIKLGKRRFELIMLMNPDYGRERLGPQGYQPLEFAACTIPIIQKFLLEAALPQHRLDAMGEELRGALLNFQSVQPVIDAEPTLPVQSRALTNGKNGRKNRNGK